VPRSDGSCCTIYPVAQPHGTRPRGTLPCIGERQVAAIRRILVLTAEFPELQDKGEAAVRIAMTELGVLTLMILALVASLRMLRRRDPDAVAKKG